jgi:hypothetical protein
VGTGFILGMLIIAAVSAIGLSPNQQAQQRVSLTTIAATAERQEGLDRSIRMDANATAFARRQLTPTGTPLTR